MPNYLLIAYDCFQATMTVYILAQYIWLAKPKIFTLLKLTGNLQTSAIDKESLSKVTLKTF